MDGTFDFSGYQWTARATDELQGPGPNRFAAENVSLVDGKLHLKIQKTDEHWYCAGVVLQQTLGYGCYSLTVQNDISGIDRNVVFGFFVWSDDPAHAHREIDLEISRWGKRDLANGQFVVQPYDLPHRLIRFVLPRRKRHHFRFTWKPGKVIGHAEHDTTLFQHNFTEGVPPTGDERTRINLWLFKGEAPTSKKPVEVVISNFQFEPYNAFGDAVRSLAERIWDAFFGRRPCTK